MSIPTSNLDSIAQRATALYSLPAVAMEVVELTNRPHIDTQDLKECLEKDPALTCKVLRVVNSSLFGLSGEVADLNQALALIGTKPLRLLVLGFSLPDELFVSVASEQLAWYWTNTLTRAVAARLLSERLWDRPGDEAFIAGLLQDIGVLALLQELGTSYAQFLSGVIKEQGSLASLEQETLGFDHMELSASLLTHWQLPSKLTEAIALPKVVNRLARLPSPEGDLPQILHLAELLSQLVGQRRLCVLPELVEAGEAYRGMTKPMLTELVEQLQPQVDMLGEVLSLNLPDDRDYMQVLLEAHGQMALLAEDMAGPLDEACQHLLAESEALSDTMRSFLKDPKETESLPEASKHWDQQHAAHERTAGEQATASTQESQALHKGVLLQRLAMVASRCRARREELCLLLVDVDPSRSLSRLETKEALQQARQAFDEAHHGYQGGNGMLLAIDHSQLAWVLGNCDRRQAVAVAGEMIAQLQNDEYDRADRLFLPAVGVGIAAVSAVPKNFSPTRLVESAERCLYAARSCGTSSIKSIEI